MKILQIYSILNWSYDQKHSHNGHCISSLKFILPFFHSTVGPWELLSGFCLIFYQWEAPGIRWIRKENSWEKYSCLLFPKFIPILALSVFISTILKVSPSFFSMAPGLTWVQWTLICFMPLQDCCCSPGESLHTLTDPLHYPYLCALCLRWMVCSQSLPSSSFIFCLEL